MKTFIGKQRYASHKIKQRVPNLQAKPMKITKSHLGSHPQHLLKHVYVSSERTTIYKCNKSYDNYQLETIKIGRSSCMERV